jgi:hypothetical protein
MDGDQPVLRRKIKKKPGRKNGETSSQPQGNMVYYMYDDFFFQALIRFIGLSIHLRQTILHEIIRTEMVFLSGLTLRKGVLYVKEIVWLGRFSLTHR